MYRIHRRVMARAKQALIITTILTAIMGTAIQGLLTLANAEENEVCSTHKENLRERTRLNDWIQQSKKTYRSNLPVEFVGAFERVQKYLRKNLKEEHDGPMRKLKSKKILEVLNEMKDDLELEGAKVSKRARVIGLDWKVTDAKREIDHTVEIRKGGKDVFVLFQRSVLDHFRYRQVDDWETQSIRYGLKSEVENYPHHRAFGFREKSDRLKAVNDKILACRKSKNPKLDRKIAREEKKKEDRFLKKYLKYFGSKKND